MKEHNTTVNSLKLPAQMVAYKCIRAKLFSFLPACLPAFLPSFLPPSLPPCLPASSSDMLNYVIASMDKRKNLGMHNPLNENMVSNYETTLFSIIIYHQQMLSEQYRDIFHIYFLEDMLDLVVFLSTLLITNWLSDLLNNIYVFR